MTFVVSWVFLTLASALVYRVLPDVKIAWRNVWIGAGVTGLLFLLGNHLIGWYLAVAGIASVLWCRRFDCDRPAVGLLFSQAVLFGHEFTRVYAEHRGLRLEPKENAVRVHRKGHA